MTTRSKNDSDGALATLPKPLPLASSADVSDELYEEQLREHAQQFMPSAIERLTELATDAPAAVQRGALNDIIAYGRRVPKLELTTPLAGDRAITINIMNFKESDYGKAVEAGEISTAVIAMAPSADDEDTAEAHKAQRLLVDDAEPVAEPEDEPADPLLVRIKKFGA